MGCDIHLFAEVKIAGQWNLYARIPFPRWYGAFEKLAGVRGNLTEAIAAPRGLPDDASIMTRFLAEYDGLDGHSHSWLDAREIEEFSRWLRRHGAHRQPKIFDYFDLEHETSIYFFGNRFAGFENSRAREKGVQDLRFVFWFDN